MAQSKASNGKKEEIVWLHVVSFIALHLAVLILVPQTHLRLETAIFTLLYGYATAMGITAGIPPVQHAYTAS
ncbi:hypothetical protein ASPWEDRAFT_38015 [Aspergillus wentii DTO 134E9]|uniref:Uncharacterized protein n=1 Tax=Aspergillus wentii DTO 134E9 TaxID=1073089 RepID=A0A1L9RNJ7_ASPWE|nr:uncharacterized protein ASPWEDRAFT_38015 [Aspergillus wentii DTO 134E9]OJJ36443.1 hypothetical protein ASPWEDRAFT_38015 [Aspergillus wentii DTO 134E9]